MRRSLLAVTACGLLLLSTACGTDSAAPKPAATTAPAAGTTSTAPSTTTAKTTDAKGCKKLRATVNEVMPKFGDELAKILASKAQNDQAGIELARTYLTGRLDELAYKLKQDVAKSDPALKTAVAQAAASVERSSKDAAFLAQLESPDTASSGTLTQALAGWLQPINAICP